MQTMHDVETPTNSTYNKMLLQIQLWQAEKMTTPKGSMGKFENIFRQPSGPDVVITKRTLVQSDDPLPTSKNSKVICYVVTIRTGVINTNWTIFSKWKKSFRLHFISCSRRVAFQYESDALGKYLLNAEFCYIQSTIRKVFVKLNNESRISVHRIYTSIQLKLMACHHTLVNQAFNRELTICYIFLVVMIKPTERINFYMSV